MSYRVEVMLPTDVYAEYTSKRGVGQKFAESLGRYLRRNQSGGRIVDCVTGIVLDEWKRVYSPKDKNYFVEKVERLRSAAGF